MGLDAWRVRQLDVQSELDFPSNGVAMERRTTARPPQRGERLGFRIDEETKGLIERAARLERRKVTDFCLTALTDAARRSIAAHEVLTLSDADRDAFFDALVNPPPVNDRLSRAFEQHRQRVKS